MASGAIYVRERSAGPVTAVRVGATAPSGAAGDGWALASANAAEPSLYEVLSAFEREAPLVAARPTTTVARAVATVPPTVTTTTTTAVPAAAATTAAPAAAPPAATTTTAAPTPLTPLTTILQAIAPVLSALGQASWFNAPDGTCAHRSLPLGTLVKVTRTSTGVSTVCRVNDRGPSPDTNRIIDLSLDTFQKLASPDAGVIDVRIEW